MTIDSTTKVYLNGVEQVKIIKNGSVIWEKQDNTDYFFIENTYAGQNTVTFTISATGSVPSGTYATSVQYSKNKSTWNTINFNTSNPQTITLEQGEKLYLRNNSGRWSNFVSGSRYYLIKTTSNYSNIIGGNLKTLLDYTNLDNVSLRDGCFFNCFMNNKGLTDASRLIMPTQTKPNAFQQFFRGCTSLTVAPSLPATTLTSDCYSGMFQGCTALTTAPVLPATTLAANCYQVMFKGCTSLNSVTTYANNISYSNCLDRWLENVAASGTFYNFGTATYSSGVSGIPSGWTEHTYFFIENTYAGQNTVSLTTQKNGSPTSGTYATSVEYSMDKSNWTTLSLGIGSRTISLNQGEKVYFRNNSGNWNSYDGTNAYQTYFSAQYSHSAGGNVNSLSDYNNMDRITSTGVFLRLFINDTTLTSISNLKIPSTTLTNWCYYGMFAGCIGLTDISSLSLPAMTLTPYCYCSMFENCSNLVTGITSLPATTVADSCYRSMYSNATALTTTPSTLPATNLASDCYRFMFRNTSITSGPELPATTLATRCYQGIFYGCSNLDEVTVYADNNSATDCTLNWLYGVANSGNFYNNGSATYTTSSVNGIPTGWTEVKPQPTIDYFYIENEYNGSNTITITTTKYDYSEEDPEADPLDMTKCGTNLEWSKDKSTWNTLTLTESSPNTITMNAGETVYFRNDTGKFNYMDDFGSYWYSSFTNNHSASTGGDIHTLIDYTGTNINARERYCLYELFQGNNNLINASSLTLPSSLVYGELSMLFDMCSNLTSAPSLPATTLANYCYQGMFYSCYSLTTPPNLPATTLAENCYNQMFSGCGLTTLPVISATTLGFGCYSQMFSDCGNLTTIPSNYLPITSLEQGCYSEMFSYCSNLTTVPNLPATTLEVDCYYGMFSGCSSLTTPPSLSATTLASSCYGNMFANSGITTAPVLPALTLADYCYQGMFVGTSITTAPELPADTLVEGCYQEMFANCENLNEVTCYATDITASDCTTDWLSNVAASGTLYTPDDTIYTTDDPSGIPEGWTASIIQ